MTKKQIEQFNRMRQVLLKISKIYETPRQIERNHYKSWGVEDYTECLEMAYENIQLEAKLAVKGIREIKID